MTQSFKTLIPQGHGTLLSTVSRPKSQLLKKPNKGKQALESAIKENSVGSVGYQREIKLSF